MNIFTNAECIYAYTCKLLCIEVEAAITSSRTIIADNGKPSYALLEPNPSSAPRAVKCF